MQQRGSKDLPPSIRLEVAAGVEETSKLTDNALYRVAHKELLMPAPPGRVPRKAPITSDDCPGSFRRNGRQRIIPSLLPHLFPVACPAVLEHSGSRIIEDCGPKTLQCAATIFSGKLAKPKTFGDDRNLTFSRGDGQQMLVRTRSYWMAAGWKLLSDFAHFLGTTSFQLAQTSIEDAVRQNASLSLALRCRGA